MKARRMYGAALVWLLVLVGLAACGRPAPAPPERTTRPAQTPAPTTRAAPVLSPARLPPATVTLAPTPAPSPPPPSPSPTAVPERPPLDAQLPYPLAYLDEQGFLWLIGTDGAQQVLAGGVDDFAWSPAGTRLALLQVGNLVLLPVDGGEALPLIESGQVWELSWSPRGDVIAVVEQVSATSRCLFQDDPATRILLVDMPAGGCRELLDGSSPGARDTLWNLQWSPDGRTLYTLGCGAATTAPLLSVDVETGHVREFTGLAWDYAVLPAEGHVLVREHHYIDLELGGSHRVACEYDAGGSLLGEWPELENSLFAVGPGRAVAFSREFSGTLYIRRPDASVMQVEIAPDLLDGSVLRCSRLAAMLDWSPDARWLAVEWNGSIWLVETAAGKTRYLARGHVPRWRPGPTQP